MNLWDIVTHLFLIGDCGNTNGANTLIQQFAMSWQTITKKKYQKVIK